MIKRSDIERFTVYIIDMATRDIAVNGVVSDDTINKCLDEVQASIQFSLGGRAWGDGADLLQRERHAVVLDDGVGLDEVEPFLPGNYSAKLVDGVVMIKGFDKAGWTLDGYVIPRLSSGCIVATPLYEDVGTNW